MGKQFIASGLIESYDTTIHMNEYLSGYDDDEKQLSFVGLAPTMNTSDRYRLHIAFASLCSVNEVAFLHDVPGEHVLAS